MFRRDASEAHPVTHTRSKASREPATSMSSHCLAAASTAELWSAEPPSAMSCALEVLRSRLPSAGSGGVSNGRGGGGGDPASVAAVASRSAAAVLMTGAGCASGSGSSPPAVRRQEAASLRAASAVGCGGFDGSRRQHRL